MRWSPARSYWGRPGGKPVAPGDGRADDQKVSQSGRMFSAGGPSSAAGTEFAASLMPLWGLSADADVTPADVQGVNNHTFVVRCRHWRCVLRVTGFLTMAEVRAEHRILGHLRDGDLPFRVPEPVTATNGQTVVETTAG